MMDEHPMLDNDTSTDPRGDTTGQGPDEKEGEASKQLAGGDVSERTGEAQAAENRENDPPA